jgi:magnesium chelatase family protein
VADGEPSTAIKARVDRARLIQKERFQRRKKIYCNGQMGPRDLKKYCLLDPASDKLAENAMERLGLSARSYHRILKLSRTIADLDSAESINASHVGEAIQYRRLMSRDRR